MRTHMEGEPIVGSRLIGNELGAYELTVEQVSAARLAVADRSVDASDCRLLLDICGLL